MAKVMHNQQQNQDLNISLSGTICVLYAQGAHDHQREGACDPTAKCCDPCCNYCSLRFGEAAVELIADRDVEGREEG